GDAHGLRGDRRRRRAGDQLLRGAEVRRGAEGIRQLAPAEDPDPADRNQRRARQPGRHRRAGSRRSHAGPGCRARGRAADGVRAMRPAWWLILGLALMLVELFNPGAYMLWLGL